MSIIFRCCDQQYPNFAPKRQKAVVFHLSIQYLRWLSLHHLQENIRQEKQSSSSRQKARRVLYSYPGVMADDT